MTRKMADGSGQQSNGDDQPVDDRGQNNQHMDIGDNGIEVQSIVEAYSQEYEDLDNTLDAIDTWMNKLEQQNDNLSAELDELLESSRQARKELQQSQEVEMETKDSSEKS